MRLARPPKEFPSKFPSLHYKFLKQISLLVLYLYYHFLKKKIKNCDNRESNPDLLLGRQQS